MASPILQLWSHLIRTKLLLLPRHSRSSKNFRFCSRTEEKDQTSFLLCHARTFFAIHWASYLPDHTYHPPLTPFLPQHISFSFSKRLIDFILFIFFGCGRSLLHEDSLVEASQGYSSLQLLIIVAFAVAAHGLRGCGTQALFVAPQHLGSSQTRESKLCPLHCKADS